MKADNILLGMAIFILSMYALYLGKTELAATGMGALAGVLTQVRRKPLDNSENSGTLAKTE